MPTFTVGPLSIRHDRHTGQIVRHAMVHVLPTATLTEITLRLPGRPVTLVLARPHYLRLRTVAGARRIGLRPPLTWRLASLALAAGVVAPAFLHRQQAAND